MASDGITTLTCIRCPKGCLVSVEISGGIIASVHGNSCRRGDIYARAEVRSPMRMVTSSVPVVGSKLSHMVSVKTEQDVPKHSVQAVVDALQGIELKAPVHIGDVVLSDVCGTGVNIVATRDAL